MEANEIRLGNWIKEPIESGGKIGQVKRITTDKDGYSHYLDHCSHIPLTEEWLVKMGAIQVKAKRGVAKAFKLGSIRIEMSNSGNFYYKKNVYNYVHMIQNLYFAIEQEELNLI